MAIKIPFSIVLNWLSSNGWLYISGHFKNTESFLQVACALNNVIYCTRSDTAKRVFRDIDKVFPLSRKAIWREPRAEINIIKKIRAALTVKMKKSIKMGIIVATNKSFIALSVKSNILKERLNA